MTRVLLVDDHALIRRGLRDALCDEGVQVAGEAGRWEELEPQLGEPFDVLLLDLQLPGLSGLEILERLAARAQPLCALVLSMYPEDPYALRAVGAGALGFVGKSEPTAILVEAIARVSRGGRHVSPTVAALLAPTPAPGAFVAAHEALSPRERLLLMSIARGLKLAEVAQHMDLPPKTVSVYRARLLEKLQLAGNAELTHFAQTQGWV